MQNSVSIRAILATSCVFGAAAFSSGALAQALTEPVPAPSISTRLPAQIPAETVETSTGPDGVETVTRTRRIPARTAPVQTQAPAAQTYPGAPYAGSAYQAYPTAAYPAPAASQPVVVGQEQWINECRRRTAGRSDSDRNQIIGGLLGAAVGGLAGNRIANGERLGGTLIGAGAGGLAGAAIGSALNGDDDGDRSYDCEAALNDYVSQYRANGGRIAARTIPSGSPYVGYAPQGYYPYQGPVYQGAYQQPSQVVWVPIEVEQQQRVVVRETVREERVPATRTIPAPRRVPVPANSKLIKE